MTKLGAGILSFILLITVYNCSMTKTKLTSGKGAYSYSSKEYNGHIWMTENLKARNDHDGRIIKYYFPNNDSSASETFGLLYDYETACKVCPAGWRLPTAQEWEDLLGVVGRKSGNGLKDSSYWKTAKPGFTNSTGFSIRPAGYGNTGEFENLFGTHAIFWSNTKVDTHFVKGFVLSVNSDSMRSAPQHPAYAFSVRCIRDSTK